MEDLYKGGLDQDVSVSTLPRIEHNQPTTFQILCSMGMSSDDSERALASFIQWISINQSPMSSISTPSDMLSSSQGYRIAKTTVKATYKLPKKRMGTSTSILGNRDAIDDD